MKVGTVIVLIRGEISVNTRWVLGAQPPVCMINIQL